MEMKGATGKQQMRLEVRRLSCNSMSHCQLASSLRPRPADRNFPPSPGAAPGTAGRRRPRSVGTPWPPAVGQLTSGQRPCPARIRGLLIPASASEFESWIHSPPLTHGPSIKAKPAASLSRQIEHEGGAEDPPPESGSRLKGF